MKKKRLVTLAILASCGVIAIVIAQTTMPDMTNWTDQQKGEWSLSAEGKKYWEEQLIQDEARLKTPEGQEETRQWNELLKMDPQQPQME